MQGISEVKKEEPLTIQQDFKYRRKSAKSERNHTEASAKGPKKGPLSLKLPVLFFTFLFQK